MIEKIKKMAELNASVVDLIKAEKMDDAVVKLAEVQALTAEIQKEAEVPAVDPAKEEIAKAEKIEKEEKIAKAVEAIEKWASLNISADTVKTLVDEMADLKGATLSSITKRLDTIEQSKGISKQATETTETASVWG